MADKLLEITSYNAVSEVATHSNFHQSEPQIAALTQKMEELSKRIFEFNYMPFGLCHAAQTFQRFMNQIFHDFDSVYVYIDDICIVSKDENEHKFHLELVFERLANAMTCETAWRNANFFTKCKVFHTQGMWLMKTASRRQKIKSKPFSISPNRHGLWFIMDSYLHIPNTHNSRSLSLPTEKEYLRSEPKKDIHNMHKQFKFSMKLFIIIIFPFPMNFFCVIKFFSFFFSIVTMFSSLI